MSGAAKNLKEWALAVGLVVGMPAWSYATYLAFSAEPKAVQAAANKSLVRVVEPISVVVERAAVTPAVELAAATPVVEPTPPPADVQSPAAVAELLATPPPPDVQSPAVVAELPVAEPPAAPIAVVADHATPKAVAGYWLQIKGRETLSPAVLLDAPRLTVSGKEARLTVTLRNEHSTAVARKGSLWISAADSVIASPFSVRRRAVKQLVLPLKNAGPIRIGLRDERGNDVAEYVFEPTAR